MEGRIPHGRCPDGRKRVLRGVCLILAGAIRTAKRRQRVHTLAFTPTLVDIEQASSNCFQSKMPNTSERLSPSPNHKLQFTCQSRRSKLAYTLFSQHSSAEFFALPNFVSSSIRFFRFSFADDVFGRHTTIQSVCHVSYSRVH